MIGAILEFITGKDDVERVACKDDARLLHAYLQRRRIWIPKRPKRFIDAASLTQENLLEQIRKDAEELDNAKDFYPWILDVDGKKRLPAFSSLKKVEVYAGKISRDMDKVFGLGCLEVFLFEVTKDLDIDVVDLNLFSPKSWEIEIRREESPSKNG